MSKADIAIYGAHWCPDCRRSKQFLGKHQIPYNWVDIEQDKEAEQFVIEKNEDKRIIQEKVLGHPRIEVRWHTEVKEFMGQDSKLNRLRVHNNQTGEEAEIPIDGAFIFIGLVPNTGFLKDSGILLDKWGFVVTGHALLHREKWPAGFEKRDPQLLETSIPGIFAAGDVRDQSTMQVVSAALMIREYLKGM